jgi:hypothetical protein
MRERKALLELLKEHKDLENLLRADPDKLLKDAKRGGIE